MPEFEICALFQSLYRRVKERASFKTNKYFPAIQSFLYFLNSRVDPVQIDLKSNIHSTAYLCNERIFDDRTLILDKICLKFSLKSFTVWSASKASKVKVSMINKYSYLKCQYHKFCRTCYAAVPSTFNLS